MGFLEQPALTTPIYTPGRIIEFHLPGGLRAIMAIRPTNTIKPYAYDGPPFYERYIYGSGDGGQYFTEVTDETTHTPFTIVPLDDGIDRMLNDPVYCGNGKVVGRILDANPTTHWMRIESNDYGRTWSMADEIVLPITGVTNEFAVGRHTNSTYAGDMEVFTLRPRFTTPSTSGEMRDALFYKSTDYGDQDWTEISDIVGWNCAALAYIGKDPSFPNKKMFLCVAGRKADGSMDETDQTDSRCLAVMKSSDEGVTWDVQQMLTSVDNIPNFSDMWLNRSMFTYLGDGVVLLQTDLDGVTSISDSVIFRSADYGASWTEIFRFPLSPFPINGFPDPVPSLLSASSGGIWYIGRKLTIRNYVPKRYQYMLYAQVFTSNNGGADLANTMDAYTSQDGGTTWEIVDIGNAFTKTGKGLPVIWNTTDYVHDIQIWWPEATFYASDNKAIPGLYD